MQTWPQTKTNNSHRKTKHLCRKPDLLLFMSDCFSEGFSESQRPKTVVFQKIDQTVEGKRVS